jgi:sugar O-acyltransferase (sialic acid O-acetyltransferase NeuD family)
MSSSVVIFGNGDIARLAHYYFTHDSDYEVLGFTVDRDFINGDSFCGLPLVPFESVESCFPPDEVEMFVAISYAQVNRLRAEKYQQAKDKGYRLASYVSSKATCLIDKEADIGDNCFILEDNTLQPFVKIGNNVTLWSGNHIGHDAHVMDHVFIASHVVVSGHVVIEPYCFLGVNATLRNGIRIAESCVIGAGALIMKDTEPQGVYTVPAAQKRDTLSSELSRL